MDNATIFLTELSKFSDFKYNPTESTKKCLDLTYLDKLNISVFLLFDDFEHNGNMPLCLLKNSEIDYPHIMHNSITIGSIDYRYICLYQGEYYIFSSLTYKQKIHLMINSLISLINLNEREIEQEYQKEFLYYWNLEYLRYHKYHSYVYSTDESRQLQIYQNRKADNLYRIVDKGTRLNDHSEWKESNANSVYVPITDSSGIIPNFSTNKWRKKELQCIFQNHDVDKISKDTYRFLSKFHVRNKVIIVFSMQTPNKRIQFACQLSFNSQKEGFLLDKIGYDLKRVDNIKIEHRDFKGLCESIGNNFDLYEKKIGIIGMGSLGSYIMEELINAGVTNAVIFDNDYFENVNLLRHKLSMRDIGSNKAYCMKNKLNYKHPQLNIEYYEELVTRKNIKEILNSNNIEFLIITVGSTDTQIEFEEEINKLKRSIVVIYTWLEIDGINSKVLVTDSRNKSCFRDYVSQDSDVIKKDDFILHDGCGGTRIKYGNRTLLTATNALLHAFENIKSTPIPFIISANIVDGLNVHTLKNEKKEINIELKDHHENLSITQ